MDKMCFEEIFEQQEMEYKENMENKVIVDNRKHNQRCSREEQLQ